MDTATQQLILNLAHDSHVGTRSFGEVVGALIQAGVESYQADYRRAETTYYMPDGSSFSIPLAVPALAISEAFDAAAVQAAIRGSQRGEVKYPEFLERSMAAGCVGYHVWIAGRHVAYHGRKGEVHLEPFPR